MMKKSRPVFFLILVFTYQLLNVATVFCLDLGFARADGGQAGAFLSYGAGPRALGLGKAFVGVADDATTVYWNPAGLGLLGSRELHLSHVALYENTQYDFLSYAYPLSEQTKRGAWGVALVNLRAAGFQIRDENNCESGEAKISESAVLLAYGKTLWRDSAGTKKILMGGTLKAVRQDLTVKSASGFGCDAGWYAGWRGISLGLNLRNIIAPRLTLSEVTNKYPFSATLGSSWRFGDRWLIALDLNKTAQRGVKIHVGSEYSMAKAVSFRCGLDETEATGGLGVKHGRYTLDYAVAYHDARSGYLDLGLSHRFGLTVTFPGFGAGRDTKITAPSKPELPARTEPAIVPVLPLKTEPAPLVAPAPPPAPLSPESLTPAATPVLPLPPSPAPVISKPAGKKEQLLAGQKIYEQALRLYKAGKWSECLDNLTAALKLLPGHEGALHYTALVKSKLALAYYQEGEKLLKALKFGPAQDKFDQALKIYPKLKIAQERRLEAQQKSKELNQKQADRYYYDGLRYYMDGDLENAIRLWEDACRLNPEHPKARTSLERVRREWKERKNK